MDNENVEISRKFRENFQNDYYEELSSNDNFWIKEYNNLSIEKRLHLWFLEIVGYEHMMGGEFNPNSIEKRANLITIAIKDKDKEYNSILKFLYKKLNNNALQVDEISQYFAKKIKEYSNL